MFPDDRMIARDAARYWWVPLVSGVAWLLIGWVVLRMNQTSVATVGVLIGVVLLWAALTQVALAALAPGGWKVWHYVMAFIFFLGGLWGFIRPVNDSALKTMSEGWKKVVPRLGVVTGEQDSN